MHRVFKKDQILTVPNLLSVVRLLLIPLILWLYCGKQEYTLAVAVIALSGLTDIADGIIARKCGAVSDFGKILDPIADKLTQVAIIICLIEKHRLMLLLTILFALKELSMAVLGLLAIKRTDAVNSAKWYGKANTVLLYAVMMLLILFPGMPEAAANTLIVLCAAMLVFSFAQYIRFYKKLFSDQTN